MLNEWLRVYYDCYHRLHKPGNGFAIPEIPFDEVIGYARVLGYKDTEHLLYFYDMVNACDRARITHYAQKSANS